MKEAETNKKSYLLEIFDIAKYAMLIDDEKTWCRANQMMMEDMLSEIEAKMEDENAIRIGISFSEEQIELMRQILNMVCKPEHNFFTNDSSLIGIWFPLTRYIPLSENALRAIWNFVLNVVDADKEEWLISYWTFADQYYRFQLEDIVVAEQKDYLIRQRQQFKQFHLGLCAYVLYREKYSLLKKLLNFTQEFPPSYSLIDNTLEEICKDMDRIYQLKEIPFLLTKKYMMSGLVNDVNSDAYIAGKFNQYFALLAVRLNIMDYNVSYCNPMSIPYIDANVSVQELKEQRRNTDILLHFLLDKTFSRIILKLGYSSKQVRNSIDVIKVYQGKLNDAIDKIYKYPKTDSGKIALIKKKLINEINFQKQNLPTKDESALCDDVENEKYKCSQSLEVSKEDISIGMERLSANMEEVLIASILRKENANYVSFFYYNKPIVTYNVQFRDLMTAWERLGVNGSFTILSMGVYLGTYNDLYENHPSFEYSEEESSFNGARIINLQSSMRAFVIIPTASLPYVEYIDMDKKETEDMFCLDESNKLYSNVDKLNAQNNRMLKVQRKTRLVYKKGFTKYVLLKISYSGDSSKFDLDKIENIKNQIVIL